MQQQQQLQVQDGEEGQRGGKLANRQTLGEHAALAEEEQDLEHAGQELAGDLHSVLEAVLGAVLGAVLAAVLGADDAVEGELSESCRAA